MFSRPVFQQVWRPSKSNAWLFHHMHLFWQWVRKALSKYRVEEYCPLVDRSDCRAIGIGCGPMFELEVTWEWGALEVTGMVTGSSIMVGVSGVGLKISSDLWSERAVVISAWSVDVSVLRGKVVLIRFRISSKRTISRCFMTCSSGVSQSSINWRLQSPLVLSTGIYTLATFETKCIPKGGGTCSLSSVAAVKNLSSNTMWNWGLMLPVVVFHTKGTLLE